MKPAGGLRQEREDTGRHRSVPDRAVAVGHGILLFDDSLGFAEKEPAAADSGKAGLGKDIRERIGGNVSCPGRTDDGAFLRDHELSVPEKIIAPFLIPRLQIGGTDREDLVGREQERDREFSVTHGPEGFVQHQTALPERSDIGIAFVFRQIHQSIDLHPRIVDGQGAKLCPGNIIPREGPVCKQDPLRDPLRDAAGRSSRNGDTGKENKQMFRFCLQSGR